MAGPHHFVFTIHSNAANGPDTTIDITAVAI